MCEQGKSFKVEERLLGNWRETDNLPSKKLQLFLTPKWLLSTPKQKVAKSEFHVNITVTFANSIIPTGIARAPVYGEI